MKNSFQVLMKLLLIGMVCSVSHNICGQELASLKEMVKRAKSDQNTNMALTKVLSELEAKYHTSFSYDKELLEDKMVDGDVLKEIGDNLEKSLTALLQPFRLKHEKFDQDTYVIYTQVSPKALKKVKKETSLHFENAPANNANPLQKLLSRQILAKKVVEETITGTVTDSENSEPLPGVNVLVKGTTLGTVTDVEGKYSLNVPDEDDILVFSSIGYITQEIAVNGRSVIDVALAEDVQSLEEVVVVGYGTQRKSDLTGSVGTVKGETLQKRPAASLNQALAGRVPGVNVSVNSGRPGGMSRIRIRGNTSVSNTNNPLYVIDGVILNTTSLTNGSTPIDYIDPSSIASIEVLKDASATAIYGARGANGVILVTTKRGSQDGGRVTLDSYVSVGTLTRKLDLLNSREFLMVEDIAYQNAQKYDSVGWAAGKYEDPQLKRTNPLLFDADGNPLYDTDWQEEATQAAITQSHQLSLTGGDAKASYGVFLGYRDEEGVMKKSHLKRYSGRFVFDSQLKDWLKVGGNLNYNVQDENQIDPLGGGGIIPMRQVLEELPIIPVKYPDGTYGSNEDYPGMEGGGSYLEIVNKRFSLLNTQTMLGNVYANIKLAEGLELRTSIGTNIINQRVDYYAGRDLNYISRSQQGVASVSNEQHNSWQFENYLTYKKQISDLHSFTGLLGMSWQHVSRFGATARANGFQDDYFKFNNLGAGSNPQPPSSGANGYGLNSYFGRLNYSLKDKYLLTLTGRADGSSKFGSENRYAFFPSAALAWRVSEEDFIQNIQAISNLKVRASYGVTGNSEIGAYQGLAGMGNYSYIFGGERAVGVGINRLANPNLQWEKNHQIDAGIELGLFNDRISLEADVYRKLSTDMLLDAPVPSSSGYSSVSRNVGSMENRGFEFMLTTFNISTNDFLWNTTFNISVNKNEVKKLTGGSDLISGETIVREGEPVNSFFGFLRLGTWSTDEAEEAAQYNRLPGDLKYQDTNNDGQLNQADRIIIGKGVPDGFGSLINTFNYKNFELTVDLQFMYGNDVLYHTQHSAEDRQGIANSLSSVLNAWTPEHQNTPIAQFRPVSAGYDTHNDGDSHRIYDGSFIRGRNLLLAYNFSQEIINRLGLSRLRAYASMQNFFLTTEYPGYDPEATTSGGQFAQGLIFYDYPKPKVFMLGLNISL